MHMYVLPLGFFGQEKGRMATDLKRLKKHFKAYEPTLKELERKYKVVHTQIDGESIPCFLLDGVRKHI